MKHENKVKLARKMQTRLEQSKYRPNDVYSGIFLSAAWEKRRAARRKNVLARQAATHARAVARKADKQPGIMTRARMRIQAAMQRRTEARRARQARYDAKHASLAA